MPIQVSQNGNVALPEGRTPEGNAKIINMPDAPITPEADAKIVGLPGGRTPEVTHPKLY